MTTTNQPEPSADQLWADAVSASTTPAAPENTPAPDQQAAISTAATPAPAQQEQDEIAAKVARLRQLGGQLGAEKQARMRAEAEAAALKAQLEALTAGGAGNPAPKLQKFEQLRADAPDWADGVQELVEAKLGSVKAAPPAPTRDLVRQEIAHQMIEDVHPGWSDIVKTPEFEDFLKAAPPEIAKLSESARPRDAIAMLDAFMESLGQPRKPSLDELRQQRLREAAALPGRSGTTGGGRLDAQLSEEDVWAQEAKKVWG